MATADKSTLSIPLGYRGAVTARLHPAIRLRPALTDVVLRGSLTPALKLEGGCDNLEGRVPCTLVWIVKRDNEPEREELHQAKKIEIEGAGNRYKVLVDGRPLESVDILKLNLLGKGKLGFKLRPDTPRQVLTVPPDLSRITFDYEIAYERKQGAKVGERVRIDPVRPPECLKGLPVRLTVFDSDAPGLGRPFVFEWKLGDPHPESGKESLAWKFGCGAANLADDKDHEGVTFDYCEQFESDGRLEYGARLEVLDQLSDKGKKGATRASIELRDQWTGTVPLLGGFSLRKAESAGIVGDDDASFEAEGSLSGFDPALEVQLEVELWATNGAEVRHAGDVLLELRDLYQPLATGVPYMLARPTALPGSTRAVTARWKGGAHHFAESVLDIDQLVATVRDVDAAKAVLATWKVFAELRLSPQMTGGGERPMMQVARFGAGNVGVDHGVVGRRYSAVGVGSALVSFEGIVTAQRALSDADQFDACVLAMCIYTEARDAPTPADLRLEMLHVGGCVMNRVRTRYRGTSYYEVVLSEKQYSRFNTDVEEKRVLVQAKAKGNVEPIVGWASGLPKADSQAWERALSVAEELVVHPERNPFESHPTVRHYYSPVAMKGKTPDWADSSKKFAVAGISENRFLWFEGIA